MKGDVCVCAVFVWHGGVAKAYVKNSLYQHENNGVAAACEIMAKNNA